MTMLTVEWLGHQGDGAVLVVLAGELDLSCEDSITRLGNRFLVEADGARLLRLDMTAVTFMDSTGLRSLLGTQRAIAEIDGRLVIVASEPVRQVLELTGLAARFSQ